MIDWEKDEEKRKNAITFVEATQALIDAANDNGGKDNIAVVLVKPFSGEVKE